MKISVVTTLFYSQNYLQEFYNRTLRAVLSITDNYEFVFVNDGSPDLSLEKVLQIQKGDNNVVIIDLSRNFGHHKAIMTGLRFATGDYVYLIDCDLEEEPELLLPLWEEMTKSQDMDVVFGIQPKRKGNFFERVSGSLFYSLFSLLASIDYPHNTLTARLMSRRYVQGIDKYTEKELDIWGIFVLNGFSQKGIYLTKGSKGSSTYSFKKKVKMAIDTITSFSSRPLYLVFVVGVFVLAFSFLNVLYIVYQKIIWGKEIEGWASILASVWLIGGLIIFILGIIGMYLAKLFSEIKNRPLTVIRDIYKRP
jgi:putative glycosyltransferase